MLKNLVSVSNKFYEDQALIFLAFGGFGRYVLSLLYTEFKRLGIPDSKVNFLAFDTEKPHRDRIDLRCESDYFVHLDQFDGDVYVDNPENEELKEAVKHIPVNYLYDIEGGCKGVPAVGFVSFHKYDDLIISRESLKLIDDVRSKNPGKKIKLIMISGMGGSVSNGMTVPFLFKVRNRLREKRIRVEVFLATSEGYLGIQNVQERGVERNCIASAMLWEYALAGKNGLSYPGKGSKRGLKMFDGRIAHRTYIFSGGSSETSLKYPEVAATIAQCISTLETTKVGSYLDGDRVNYSAHILEREWIGKKGNTHPTSLMTMNVTGLKGDSLPQLFHLHMVKGFIEKIIGPLSEEYEGIVKGKTLSCFLANNLNEDDIQGLFTLEIPEITSRLINEQHVTEEGIYEFLKDKITSIQTETFENIKKKSKCEKISKFLEKVKENISNKAKVIGNNPGCYISGTLAFYDDMTRLLENKIKVVNESIKRIEHELFDGSSEGTVKILLEKLKTVSKKKNMVPSLVLSLGQSTTHSLVNQILEICQKVQNKKRDKYNHILLLEIYNSLLLYTQEKKSEIQRSIGNCNKLIEEIENEENNIRHVGRSSFPSMESQFARLADHIMERLDTTLHTVPPSQVIERLGESIGLEENYKKGEILNRLLNIIKPDIYQLKKQIEELFLNDEEVYQYLKTAALQFFMTLKLDRDKFPTLETSHSCFVICTQKLYQRYKNEFFEGYSHIETDNPFNVLLTKHDEGFPFIAISYINRINESFKDMASAGEASFGHIMSSLSEKLSCLDE